jgi:hypothetical protein
MRRVLLHHAVVAVAIVRWPFHHHNCAGPSSFIAAYRLLMHRLLKQHLSSSLIRPDEVLCLEFSSKSNNVFVFSKFEFEFVKKSAKK